MYNIGYSPSLSRDSTDARASKYISGVYVWMSLGVLVSAIMAWFLVSTGLIGQLLHSTGRAFMWLVMGLQIGSVFAFTGSIRRMNVSMSRILYFSYAAITGLTLAVILLIYKTESVIGIFTIASFAFAGLAAFGAVTKRNLGPIGTFCGMGLFMLVGMSLLYMLAASFGFMSGWLESLNLTMGVIGIVIFSGLTAWESQQIRENAYSLARSEASSVMVNTFVTSGAFTMYLNFINLFISLLRVFGSRR